MGIFDKKNIVKVEEEDLKDAKLSSVDFTDENIRKRAFLDVLGARLAIKMLFSKKIQANNVYSMYTIHSVLEDLDIADVYFNGIKMDVRLVFNREEIFIPKKHFEYNLLPDFYLVLELNSDLSCAEPLGFFEPENINKENQNRDFYFIEYEKLQDIKEVKSFLKKYKSKNLLKISQENIEKSQELFLPLVDKIISEDDKLFLFKQLASDFGLREKFVEFENFELISKSVAKDESILSDGVLNIVGAQQLYQEDEQLTKEEEKAEIIGEVLTDLLEDGLGEKEISEPNEGEMSFEDEMQEILTDKTEEIEEGVSEDKDSGKTDSAGAFISGAVAGAAIAGTVAAASGAAAAAAASEDAIIAGSAEVLSAGISSVGDIVKDVAGKVIDKDIEIEEIEEICEPQITEEVPQEEETFEAIEDDLDSLISEIEDEIEPKFAADESSQELEVPEDIEPISEVEVEEDFAVETPEFSDLEPVEEEVQIIYEEEKEQKIEPAIEESEPEDLFALPEIDFGESEFDKGADVAAVNDDDDVVNLDKFDFESLKQDTDKTMQIEADIIASPDDLDIEPPAYLSLAQAEEVVELQEEPQEEIEEKFEEEVAKPILDEFDGEIDDEETLEDESDKLISEFDGLLGGADLTEEQKALLESTLGLIDEDENKVDIVKEVKEEVQPPKITEDDNKVDALFSPEQISIQAEALEHLQKQTENLKETYSIKEEENVETEDESETENSLKGFYEAGKKAIMSKIPYSKEEIVEKIQKNKKLILAASVAGVILTSTVVVLNSNKNNTPLAPATPEPQVSQEGQALDSLSMDNAESAEGLGPDMAQPGSMQSVQSIPGEGPQEAQNREMGQAVSDAFLSEPVNANISKIAWEVPEDLAYNDGFRKYLQVAGKNLKLNLQNDLLLATEMAYSNKVIIDLTIAPDGSLQNSSILSSSGSKQIDKIVLQSVKETLKYLKMPSSELGGTSADVTLIINF